MKRLAVILVSLPALAAAGVAVTDARADPPPPGYDSLGADWGAQQDQARQGVRQQHYMPLGQVIAEINKRNPGYQLDAGLETWMGRTVYRVRWAASSGRRIDYIVDAVSGAILTQQ